jgi:hypothetical protein
MSRPFLILTTLLSALWLITTTSVPAFARDEAKASGQAPPKKVTMKGPLVCLGCELKKAHGAGAQCNIYGHKHALKTTDGKYYTFLENQKSEPLIKGEKWHGKTLDVSGTLFPGTQIIEVSDYKVAEEKVTVNVCPVTGADSTSGAGGTSVVGNYLVKFCCPGCKPAFDKLSQEEKEKKIAAVMKENRR